MKRTMTTLIALIVTTAPAFAMISPDQVSKPTDELLSETAPFTWQLGALAQPRAMPG